MNTYRLRYYAVLREQCGISEETVESDATTIAELYREICRRHNLTFPAGYLKVAQNGKLVPWNTALHNQDEVAWLPPYSGG